MISHLPFDSGQHRISACSSLNGSFLYVSPHLQFNCSSFLSSFAMALWDPRQILDVYPQRSDFTCVGTTREGRRCRQSFLKNVHRAEANRLLDILPPPGHFASNSSQLYPTLRHLAWLTLCPRWHQNGPRCQADAVASKWLRKITDSVPGAATYAGYPVPSFLPLSSPQSPVPNIRTIDGAPPSLQAHNTHPATLPPLPQLSPTQHSSSSTVRYADQVLTTVNSPSEVSSSIQTATRNGSIRIELNVTIVLEQHGQANAARRSSNNLAAISPASNDAPRRPASSTSGSSSQVSSHSGSLSSSTTNQSITYLDVQTILARLESLERQAAQIINSGRSGSSRSSRTSYGGFNRSLTDPRSSVASTISDLYLPPPVGHPEFFFSPPRSPPPIPHAGSLSISSDSEPTSPVLAFNTPSSSDSSTPVVSSRPSMPSNEILRPPGPSSVQAIAQRQPIAPDTECGICLEPILRAEDAVWCRGTCGQNLHTECFDEWRPYRNGNPVLCTYWFVLAFMSSLLLRQLTCFSFSRQPWVF
jgi:hypothetical protein